MVMYSFKDLKDKIKKHFWVNKKEEIKAIIISILILGFVVGFDDGKPVFNLLDWFSNLIIVLIIVAVSFLAHITIQKIQALEWGFKLEYKLWWYGLIIALAAAFFSRGKIWLLIPGGIFLHIMPVHRLGWFRYRTNMMVNGVVALLGPLTNVALALICRGLLIFMPGNTVLYNGIFVNLWMAVFTMLPIPPLDGSRVFFFSRLNYVLIVGSIFGLALLLKFTNINILVLILLSLIVGVIIWAIYFWFVEKG